jgi:hypothetical protein
MGNILGFVPAGKNLVGNLLAGAPIIRIGEERHEVNYTSVQTVPKKGTDTSMTIEATASFQGENGEKAFITTQYRFSSLSGTIEVESTIKNTGNSAIQDLGFSLYLNAMHRYSFSPFHRERYADLGFRIYQKKGHFLGILNKNPLSSGNIPVPGTLAPGESHAVRYLLLAETDGGKLLGNIYPMMDIDVEKTSVSFEMQDRGTTELIVRDVLSRSVFYRTYMKKPLDLEIPLPPGLYEVTANFFPAVMVELFQVEEGQENSLVMNGPPMGTFSVKIQNSDGQYVPGKVTFIGLDPTKSPYFEPENPVDSGRYWESFKNSRFPDEKGMDVRLPAGNYLVYASRGPEYTMETKIVEIFQDETAELIFQIDKVVDTENLISVDPHMHTFYSDGRMDIAERIKSVVSEGVDVAVASDHNYINDYRPVLNELGLNRYLATIVGNEVTTGGVIHYNTYPLVLRES